MNTPASVGFESLEKMRRAVARALLWVVVLGVAALVVVSLKINARDSRSSCSSPKALSCLEQLKPSSMTLELAGDAKRVACQLLNDEEALVKSVPSASERVCLEHRAQTRWEELTQLDARLFMPFYGLVSFLVAAWLALNTSTSVPTQPRAFQRAKVAGPLVAFTLVLLFLDGRENASATVLLMGAEGTAFEPRQLAAFDAAAALARQASLHKWTAAALWAGSVAWGLWHWKAVWICRLQRWARWTALVCASLTCIFFGLAVVVAVDPARLAGPVHLLQAGFLMSFVSMLAVTAAVAAPTHSIPMPDACQPPAAKEVPVDVEMPRLLLDGKGRGFHLEEYKQLRSEMTGLLGRIELLFRYSIVVAATTFAWLVSNSLGVEGLLIRPCLKLPRELLWFAWVVPSGFVLFAGVLAFTISQRVNETGTYLRRLELALGDPSLGWEAYLFKKQSILTSMTRNLWVLLFLVTLIAAATAFLTIDQATVACELKGEPRA